jgi:hypothetical protein
MSSPETKEELIKELKGKEENIENEKAIKANRMERKGFCTFFSKKKGRYNSFFELT